MQALESWILLHLLLAMWDFRQVNFSEPGLPQLENRILVILTSYNYSMGWLVWSPKGPSAGALEHGQLSIDVPLPLVLLLSIPLGLCRLQLSQLLCVGCVWNLWVVNTKQMDGPRDCHTERSKSDRETNIWHCLHVESKKRCKWTYLQSRKRVTDIENKFVVIRGSVGEG